MIVRILRQENKDSKPYVESFEYKGNGNKTVAGILEELNFKDDLLNIDGNVVPRIKWECSCMQKTCGACAMVVNGSPCLACQKFIDTDTESELALSPLTKFPVIVDLVVDRSAIQEQQKIAMMFISEKAPYDKKEQEYQYQVSKCLKCGLCLEVCPNYSKDFKNFFGAALANEAYLNYSMTEDRKKEVLAEYRKHFEKGCSKSLACERICPAGIPTLSSISYMNRKK